MKALRALRTLAVLSSSNPYKTHLNSPLLRRFYAAQPQEAAAAATAISASEDDENGDSVFNSSQYTLPDRGSDLGAEIAQEPTWDEKYREKANREIFGEETQIQRIREKEEEKKRRAAALAKALLEAALARPDEEEEEGDSVVKEEDQKSLSVGIIGAPNAGKSALTNFMVYSSLEWYCRVV